MICCTVFSSGFLWGFPPAFILRSILPVLSLFWGSFERRFKCALTFDFFFSSDEAFPLEWLSKTRSTRQAFFLEKFLLDVLFWERFAAESLKRERLMWLLADPLSCEPFRLVHFLLGSSPWRRRFSSSWFSFKDRTRLSKLRSALPSAILSCAEEQLFCTNTDFIPSESISETKSPIVLLRQTYWSNN